MPNESQQISIESILEIAEKNDTISDIHLSGGEAMAFRINGDIKRYEEAGIINEELMEIIIKQLMHGNPKMFEKFMGDKDTDFAYLSKNGIAYRVNAFLKIGKLAVVMRKINDDPKNIEDLMFADIAESIKKNVLGMTKGLYLVTGPTGSGKSTSMVSMINHLNEVRNENIITIEDPIEFIFTPKKSLINQREVGHDTRSFANALRASMREDPDIIFVGEIRDKETAEAALNLSETGHLVFSTLHTSSASMTVNRYISFFPPEIQDSIADRLADTLVGVQSQILVKNTEGSTRVGIFELMLNNTAIKNNIKKRELAQIDNIIETSSNQGMISLKQYAKRLIEQGIISTESVSRIFNQQSQE